MKLYIGIDDTDNLETRGTGYRARKMADLIIENKLADVEGITRHQLFFDPRIPYTSHNSSACLTVETENREELTEFCRSFLLEDSADGSDVGLCIANNEQITNEVVLWGQNAKVEVLTKENAYKLANDSGIYLEGLTGTKDGIIGSLAAVGLRFNGNDGRFIWIREMDLREIKGVYSASELLGINIINQIESIENNKLIGNEKIFTGDWVRPVLKNYKRTLIVEKSDNTNNYEWKIANKDYIKSISQ